MNTTLEMYFDRYTGNYVIPFEDYKNNEGLRVQATLFAMAHAHEYVKEFQEGCVILVEKSNL